MSKEHRNQQIYNSVAVKGNQIRQTAKEFSVSEATVDRVLRARGFGGIKGKKTEEVHTKIDEIRGLLESGESYRKLASEYGYAYGTFRHAIKTILGFLPDNKHSPKINHSFFEEWSPELEYLFGAIGSDGTLLRNGTTVRIMQNEIGWLELLGELVRSKDHEPTLYLTSKQPVLSISSKVLQNKLKENGINHDKAHTIEVSDYLANSVYFWRGYFEGDGGVSITSKQRYAKLTSCSKFILQQYRIFILTKGVSSVGNINKNYTTSSCVVVRDKESLTKLFDLLYADRLDLIHYRKYKNFKDMVSRFSSEPF
jgi:Mor family transcriptional regulator